MTKFIRSGWKTEHLFPLLLFILGLVVRLDLSADFDGLYGQDAFAYYRYGVEVKQAVRTLTVPGEMYWPMGFPLVLAAAFTLFGTSAEVAQMVVLVAGALTSSLTYLLIHDALTWIDWPQPGSAALTAALLVIFSGQGVQSSVVVMADVPGLCWATLSAWCLVRYALTRRRPWILLAALALALAGITRWAYLLLVLPWGLFILHNGLFLLEKRAAFLKDLFLAATMGLLILLPQLAHSRQNPAALEAHGWLQNWSLRHAAQKDFVNADGTFHYQRTIRHFYARAAWDGYYLHAIFLPFIGIGTLALLWKIRQTAPVVILFWGWLLVEYGFLIGIPYQNIRFPLAFFVPLAALAGIGLTSTVHPVFSALPTSLISGLRYAVLLIITLISIRATYTTGKAEIHHLIGLKNADLNTIEWVQRTIPAGTLYTLDLWLMMQHYAPELAVKQIYYETPDTLAQQFPSSEPTYVLLNLWAIEHQWAGKAPWIAYHWLNEHEGLTRIGRYGNYTLLYVGKGTG